MTPTIRLCLVFHNHQPIGNFENVFEQAYEDAYLPFLDVFERYSESLSISLHTSGPLMEWLVDRKPAYMERLKALVQRGKIEIVGGAFYEPILTMIPARDRVGQIAGYRHWLQDRLGGDVHGMWIPERVWEQTLTSAIVDAGVKYTVLDDFHFKNAGLGEEQLFGHFLTEDEGRVLCVFPGSEKLRYLIPFREPQETIDYLRDVASRHPGAVVVFGDDGEKFGGWPETKKHVYEDGWLRRFFDLLVQHRDWLATCTLADAYENVAPVGKVYLPDGSYREMTEWALPVEKQNEYEDVLRSMEQDQRWPRVKQFVRGGFWRNFKVKYPETNEMYARMMMVSRRFQDAEQEGASGTEFQLARRELYRAQCNCSYWHGAFGGAYLPHLRNGVYNHLIAADNLLDRALNRPQPYVEASADDYNFDARQEVRLASDQLVCFLAPSAGGQMYELDVRSICHNLLATFARRPESYHRRVLGGREQSGGIASIHDRVIFKQEGLDQRIQYDQQLRKSLTDHFWDMETGVEAVASGQALERGDFAQGAYEAVIRRKTDRIQVLLSRTGNAWGVPLKITKGVTLEAGGANLEIAYLIEGLPPGQMFHFGVEFNFAGMPAGIDDRYFFQGQDGRRLGQLGQRLNLQNVRDIGLADEWLGLQAHLESNRPTNFWAYPIETVSQSEGGYELVHQSVLVQPHWHVTGDKDGRWSVVLQLEIQTRNNEVGAAEPVESVAAR